MIPDSGYLYRCCSFLIKLFTVSVKTLLFGLWKMLRYSKSNSSMTVILHFKWKKNAADFSTTNSLVRCICRRRTEHYWMILWSGLEELLCFLKPERCWSSWEGRGRLHAELGCWCGGGVQIPGCLHSRLNWEINIQEEDGQILFFTKEDGILQCVCS